MVFTHLFLLNVSYYYVNQVFFKGIYSQPIVSKQQNTNVAIRKRKGGIFLIRPTWGEVLYFFVFFVQSILADRYFHRTELRLVSLESPSSVENGNNKNDRGFNFAKNRRNSVLFIHFFRNF